MADVDYLLSALASLDPDQRAKLAQALQTGTGGEPAAPVSELEGAQQQVDRIQTEIADLAGSEQAHVEPASVADRVNELHDQLTSLQVKVANLERAQLTVTHDDAPADPPPAP